MTTTCSVAVWFCNPICWFQALEDENHDGNTSDSSVDSGSSSGPNFNYILNMPLWCLTKEKVDELLKQRDVKVYRDRKYDISDKQIGLKSFEIKRHPVWTSFRQRVRPLRILLRIRSYVFLTSRVRCFHQ